MGATVGAALASATAALSGAGLPEPRRQARRVVAAALGLSPTVLFAHPERLLERDQEDRLAAMLARLTAHEPLSRIVGLREFWGLDFMLSADTLDPRPESETIVEALSARLPDRFRPYHFLDLGTGTGCLLLALLSEYPHAVGIGVDRATGAAATARQNAELLGLAGRAAFVVGDWAAPLAGRFDAVVANPPYIATSAIDGLMPEVRDHDPRLALDGGADGLAGYRKIARQLPHLLQHDGFFAGEIGSGQSDEVTGILRANGLAIDSVQPDLAGIERVVVARPAAQKTVGMREPAD